MSIPRPPRFLSTVSVVLSLFAIVMSFASLVTSNATLRNKNSRLYFETRSLKEDLRRCQTGSTNNLKQPGTTYGKIVYDDAGNAHWTPSAKWRGYNVTGAFTRN